MEAWDRYRNQPPPEALSLYHTAVDDIHAGAYFAATKALEQTVQLAAAFAAGRARLAEPGSNWTCRNGLAGRCSWSCEGGEAPPKLLN